MISDVAYTAIQSATKQARYSDGVFATSLRLYQENYTATLTANAGMSQTQIEALLLIPTNVRSLLDQSDREFKDNARKTLFSERAGRSLSDAAWNVFLNIIGNVIFITISIAAYLAMQDTAQNAFKSLGFEVRSKAEQSTDKGLPEALPTPDSQPKLDSKEPDR
jgi:hypothetical protein